MQKKKQEMMTQHKKKIIEVNPQIIQMIELEL
jgi:hypothetical protein